MSPSETLKQIAEDIYQVKLPLPFALRIVNCYLLRGDSGWTIIDTGLHTENGEAVWRQTLAALGIQPGDLSAIVVTHHHPDHYGMAGWLRAWNEVETPIYTSARERDMIAQVWWQVDGVSKDFAALMRAAGVDEAMLAGMLRVGAEIGAQTAPHPPRLDVLTAGERISLGAREFRILNGPGHSVGQLLLYDESARLIFCADHVLAKITPNVGIWPGSDANPLASFLDSLQSLSDLPVDLALPGHRSLIEDWPGRIAELQRHHDERLSQMRDAAGDGATALQIAGVVFNFDHFSTHEQRFAVAETLAHLEYLRQQGAIERHGDDVWIFRRC
ncbi:MAG: MBL fold metallo-hydrolase [Anaerolineae bacterium]|nr:MBL fold metallo-hydrolase [Anaerolineae bacterium]